MEMPNFKFIINFPFFSWSNREIMPLEIFLSVLAVKNAESNLSRLWCNIKLR